MWDALQSKLSAGKQNDRKWHMAGNVSRHEQICITRLRTDYWNLSSSYLLEWQERPVYICGGVLPMKHMIEDYILLSNSYGDMK